VVEDGAVIDPSDNAAAGLSGTDTTGDEYDYIKISTSEPTAFKLKDGQKLVFVDTPVGTSYKVTETGVAGYQAKVDVTTNGGAPVTTNGASIGADVATGATERVGEAANGAAFTNTNTGTTPTGLVISDIPFIGLIALAIGAVVAFVVTKSRKSRKSAAAAA